jgi:cytolysin (calcineurin-like family phosphatase)
MQVNDFRNYLNELDTLSQEIRSSPEFAVNATPLGRDEVLRRFELNRALVNLLHVATVHMVRSDAPDYDAGSEQWLTENVRTAASHIRQDLRDQRDAVVRDLSARALKLVERIMDDLGTGATPLYPTESAALSQTA